jgi:hypothetical protein
MGPGGWVLAVDLPIGFGDRVDAQQPVSAAGGGHRGRAGAEFFATDATVDDQRAWSLLSARPNMAAMNLERCGELPAEGLMENGNCRSPARKPLNV